MRTPASLISVLLVSLLLLLPNLSVLPVNIMEARNFITAREMVQDGHWLLTTLNGQPRYEKPPLPTWITAVFGDLFGFDQLFFLRLPVVLVCLMLVVLFWKTASEMGFAKRQRWIASVVLVSSFYIWFAGRDNQWDLYCHAFMMGGIFFLWRLLRRKTNRFHDAIWSGVFIGASILCKGPVSVYGLLLPFGIAYAFAFGFGGAKRNVIPVTGLALLALIIGLSWPVYVRLADPAAFLEITARETSRWNHYNTRPFYYYWSFFLQSGIWAVPALTALVYPFMKPKVRDPESYRFALAWTVAAVVLLSLIPEKKSRYLLPVLIPMAFNSSFYLDYLWRHFGDVAARKSWVIFAFGITALAGLAFPVAQYFLFAGADADLLPWRIAASVALPLCGLTIVYGLWLRRFATVFNATVALQVAVIVLAFPLAPHFLRPKSYKDTTAIRVWARAEKAPVYEFGGYSPEIVYQYGAKIPNFRDVGHRPEKFGLLAIAEDSLKVRQAFPNSQKLGFVNLNTSSRRNGPTKNRLYRDFYVIHAGPASVVKQ